MKKQLIEMMCAVFALFYIAVFYSCDSKPAKTFEKSEMVVEETTEDNQAIEVPEIVEQQTEPTKDNNQSSAVTDVKEQQPKPQPVAQPQPSINKNWEYTEEEDKLNDTKNYEANILSTDGRFQCTVAAVDLLGTGHYTNVFAVAWLDETIPGCYDEIFIGMKFPNDEKWRKIPIGCNGHGGAMHSDFNLSDELDLMKSNTSFSVLFVDEEFVFKPSKPLKWDH